MKAAILFESNTPFEIREVGVDKPGPDEVLVRVAASGLCHSDWHYATGDLPTPLPAVLGHEGAGIVEQVGSDVTGFAPGDHVVTSALVFCGQCPQCVTGHTHTCAVKPNRGADEPSRLSLETRPIAQGTRLGAFAEQMLVHRNAIVKIDRAMPLDRAALMGCSVITGIGAVFNAAQVKAGSKVVVIGAGGVGLNVVQAARIAGARQIVVVDMNPAKEGIARHFGATDFLIGGDDAIAAVREATGGGADYAFEVIGLPATIAQGVQMLVPRGLMTIVGATKLGATIPVPGVQMLFNEWRIQGTFFGSSPFTVDIPRFVDMYLNDRLDLDTLVSERIGLTDINTGFADMISGKTPARNVITFDDVLADAAAHA